MFTVIVITYGDVVRTFRASTFGLASADRCLQVMGSCAVILLNAVNITVLKMRAVFATCSGLQSRPSYWSSQPCAHLPFRYPQLSRGANHSGCQAQNDAHSSCCPTGSWKQRCHDVETGTRRHSEVWNGGTVQGRRRRRWLVHCR
jgi:hypothetical protein